MQGRPSFLRTHVRSRLKAAVIAPLLLIACGMLMAQDQAFLGHPAVERFIRQMTNRHGFEAERLRALFHQASPRPEVIEAISRPAEDKPWYEYRTIFLTQDRIEGGVAFLLRYQDELQRAAETYGVPAEVTVAIIGVETRYGRHMRRYPVFEALATLAFGYPNRAGFFRRELEQMLLLSQEESLDPSVLKGSYAGAIGIPQFISSSYRRYAVDFDGDGRRDLLNSPADAIGSVANYLREHGWKSGDPVTLPGGGYEEALSQLVKRGLKPQLTIGALRELGISVPAEAPEERLASIVRLQVSGGYEYWIALQNFYTITRYNHSAHYAMAVHQLAEAIRNRNAQASL